MLGKDSAFPRYGVIWPSIIATPENKDLVPAIAPNQDLTVPPVGELWKQDRSPYDPAYIGAPDEVIKMLEEELKVCPMTQMVFIIDPPGMAPRHIRNSLELRAKKVIPHFRDK